MQGKTVYCHFSFKRPKGKDYGLFAVAFYWDEEGKKLAAQVTRRFKLWKNHQFVTAIQSYEHALRCIYDWQGIMKSQGISCVLLVTDNSTLAGWIENHSKNKAYKEYMDRAVQQYRSGAPKEITLGVGLCEVRDYEKSYKFCREDKVVEEKQSGVVAKADGKKVIDLESSKITYKTIEQIEKSNPNKPEIVGMDDNDE